MKISFQFQISDRLQFTDKWPISIGNVIYSFSESDEKSFITAILLNQSVSLAPQLEVTENQFHISESVGDLLPSILERLESLQCSLSLHVVREIDTSYYEVFFEAESEAEKEQIKVKSLRSGRGDPIAHAYFDIAAKGLLAEPWPEDERKANQFYRRGRQAVDQRFYVDAFVNYYFFLERLYAEGKFKTDAVADKFSQEKVLIDAYQKIRGRTRSDALAAGIPLDKDPKEFFSWLVNRRGFFQHQSETDPNRWLHSTQERYAADAFVMADLCMAVNWARNGSQLFSAELNRRHVNAAKEARAIVKIIVDIHGHDPAGLPVRKMLNIEGPGTKPTASIASEILAKSMQRAQENLISVRQITATVEKTHELVFCYTCAVTD